jgi:hypothetical protein
MLRISILILALSSCESAATECPKEPPSAGAACKGGLVCTYYPCPVWPPQLEARCEGGGFKLYSGHCTPRDGGRE